MSINTLTFKNLNEIAEKIISEIKKTKDPFLTTEIVVHNTKVAQWFKAFYLKNHKEVLMNVKFTTLSVFVNGIINPERKYQILDRVGLRQYIMKALLDSGNYGYDAADSSNPINYIFDSSGEIKEGNLFEFSERLSELFIAYECDELEFNGWEKDLYNEALSLAEKDGWYTSGKLFEKKGELWNFQKLDHPVFVIDNAYITALFYDIIESTDDERIMILSFDKCADTEQTISVKEVISAPSVLREVEAVHSMICRIVQKERDVRFNDFLVYAPDINIYSNAIRRVFLQDNKQYPSIPFCIAGETQDKQDMADFLSLLSSIAQKGFFSRNDLYKFVKNPLIRRINDISNDDIDAWVDTIDKTNTHRNGRTDDWEYLKKRILLSYVVSESSEIENTTTIGGNDYLPFSIMDLSQERGNRLIDIIDKLKEWNSFFEAGVIGNRFDKDNIAEILENLDSIYSVKNTDGDEKNYLYKDVYREISRMIELDMNIPVGTFLRILEDVSRRFVSYPADLFTGGVTFMGLKYDDVLSSKYVFVMGMSSDNFPRVDIKSELDIRPSYKTSQEMDRESVHNLVENADNILFSYVKYDLQKDVEFYPASILSGYKETQIPLDEERDYEELYTEKEFRSKKYFDGITSNKTIAKTKCKMPEGKPDSVIKVDDIKKFLDNSFTYKYDKLWKYENDSSEEMLNEYENIDIDSLKQSEIVRELIQNKVANSGNLRKKLDMQNKLPIEGIGDAYEELYNEKAVKPVAEEITCGYELVKPFEVSLTASINGENVDWTLAFSGTVYSKKEGTDFYYLEAADYCIKKIKNKTYLTPYILSLAEIALKDDDTEYKIHLLPLDKIEKVFSVTPDKAREILNNCYRIMTDFKNIKYMDIDIAATDESRLDDIDSIAKLIEKIKNNSSWKYYSDRNLIDLYKESGYTANIKDELKEMAKEIKDLVLFLN